MPGKPVRWLRRHDERNDVEWNSALSECCRAVQSAAKHFDCATFIRGSEHTTVPSTAAVTTAVPSTVAVTIHASTGGMTTSVAPATTGPSIVMPSASQPLDSTVATVTSSTTAPITTSAASTVAARVTSGSPSSTTALVILSAFSVPSGSLLASWDSFRTAVLQASGQTGANLTLVATQNVSGLVVFNVSFGTLSAAVAVQQSITRGAVPNVTLLSAALTLPPSSPPSSSSSGLSNTTLIVILVAVVIVVVAIIALLIRRFTSTSKREPSFRINEGEDPNFGDGFEQDVMKELEMASRRDEAMRRPPAPRPLNELDVDMI